MPRAKRVTLSEPQHCDKCHRTIPAGTEVVKDSRDVKKGTVYYDTECPKPKGAWR